MPDFCGTRRRKRALALATVLFGSLAAWPAVANDTDSGWLDGVYSGEIGTRFWYGMGQTGKDLYGTDGSTMVSRLTYRGLTGASGEVFGQINERNYFVKGVAGLGTLLMHGTLQDEDFETTTFSPYSSTDSSLHMGNLGYVTLDGGAYVAESANARLGVFAGYSYLHQTVNAYGCTETATNTLVCAGGIPDTTRVITQANNWNALRVGVNGELEFGKGWRLRGEAAALPFVKLYGTDHHWLRTRLLRRHSGRRHRLGLPARGLGRLYARQPRHPRRRRALLAHAEQGRHPLRGCDHHWRAAAGRLEDRLLRRDRPRRLAILTV